MTLDISHNREQLESIESQLSDLIKSDKKRWVEIYELMDSVDSKRLFTPKYHSFTQWMNSMARRFHVNVSLLWERKKAGKFYHDYQEAMREAGKETKNLNDLNATSENLSLIEKISRGDMKIAADLIEKVDRDELQRKDLKNAWEIVKQRRTASGMSLAVNGHERKKQEEAQKNTDDEEIQKNKQLTATASGIFQAISRSNDWFGQPVDQFKKTNKKRYFSEFAVDTGSSRHARRIDLLLIENYTTESNRKAHIHAVEIKASKYDLEADHKMEEYTPFCDTFWVAVPAELKEMALSLILPEWGLLLYDTEKQEISVEKEATLTMGTLRRQTFETATLKLL